MSSIVKFSWKTGAACAVLATSLACSEAAKPPQPAAKASSTPYPLPTISSNPWPSQTPPGMGNQTGDCTTDYCPPVTIEIGYQGDYSSHQLPITIGQPVNWTFTARVAMGDTTSSREIRIHTIEAPTQPMGFSVTGNRTESPQVMWTPQQGTPASGEIRVIARDITRCEMTAGMSCNDFTSSAGDYDTTVTF